MSHHQFPNVLETMTVLKGLDAFKMDWGWVTVFLSVRASLVPSMQYVVQIQPNLVSFGELPVIASLDTLVEGHKNYPKEL